MSNISDSNIKVAIEYVNEETSKPDSLVSFKHVKGKITFDYIKDVVIAFSKGEDITPVTERHWSNKTRNNYAIYVLYFIIPYIFSEEEIKEYCYNKFKEYGHFEKTVDWKYLYLDELYHKVFGINYRNHKFSKSLIIKYWREASKYYKANYLYADDFIELVKKDIYERKQLKHALEIHNKYYCQATFFSFGFCLENYILPQIGDEEFVQYLKDMAEKYIEECSDKDGEFFLINYFDEYLFGTGILGNIVTTGHLEGTKKKGFKQKKRLTNCYWRAMSKYVCANYTDANKFLEFVKSHCSLTNEEWQELKEKINDINIYSGRTRKKDKALLSHIGEDKNLVLPNGTTIKQIYTVIDSSIQKAIQERKVPLKKDIWDSLLKNSNQAFSKDIKYIKNSRNIQAKTMVRTRIDDAISSSQTKIYEGNDAEIHSDKNIWKIAIYEGKDFKCISTLNFTELPGILNKEMKEVAKTLIEETSSKGIKLEKAVRAINFFKYVASNYDIKKASDTTNDIIVLYLNHMETDCNYSPLTLKGVITSLRYTFKVLINSDKFYSGKPVNNPALRISLSNTAAFINNTSPIPEEILVELDNHITEADYQTQLIYEVLMETGWRFSDVANLSSNCMMKKKDDTTAQIFVEVPKTEERRIKKGFDPYISSEITLELYSALKNYVFDTWRERETYNIDTLFYRIIFNSARKIDCDFFNNKINKICKKYNIQTIDGSYWNMTTHQTRKTVAVNLITAGASLTSVQNQLGHMDPYTTARYYAEVKRMKIGELNEEFFKKKFDILFDNDRLSRYTEEERRILYVEFSTSKRHVELGLCSLSPSEGRCNKEAMSSCSTCTKLCTGPKYLSQWEQLVSDSKKLLDEFEKAYQDNNISKEEYEQYIEYKQETKLYKHYNAVRKAIKESIDKKEKNNDRFN